MSDLSFSHPSSNCADLQQVLLDQLPLPYFEIDRHGYVTRANRAAENLHPPERGSTVGHMAWDLMAADETASSFASYCALLETGEEPAVVRYNFFVRTGQFRTFEFHRTLIRDADGRPCGMRMLCIDVTESLRSLEEARSAALWLYSIVAALPVPALVTDAIGVVRSVNPAAEIFFGWLPNAVAGSLLEQALPLAPRDDARSQPPIDFSSIIEAPLRIPLMLLDARGTPAAVEMETSPISDAQTGNLSGVVCLLHKFDPQSSRTE